ncbi:MAG TPA: HaeIII family restriction endonuclease [Pyrinomonadaceae bacterium]|jgi:hypothetical protein
MWASPADIFPQLQQAQGKALEYATAAALRAALEAGGARVALADSDAARTARRRYDALAADVRAKYDLGAAAGVRLLARLEPWLVAPARGAQFALRIQADARGEAGDVRDVLVEGAGRPVLGVSVKHNNDVAKNPRLARTLDFCRQWTAHPCTDAYFAAVAPTFAELEQLAAVGTHWSSLNLDEQTKAARFYRPVLTALAAELGRLAHTQTDAPAALVTYFLGRQDCYKLMVSVPRRTTTVQAFNFAGTLGRGDSNDTAQAPQAFVASPRLPLPTKLSAVAFKPRSDNTLLLTFDQGWVFSLRLHNASAHVEPSLKLDVRLIQAPPALVELRAEW